MKENLRSTVRSAFFEALFVVFGVILALAANEWRENVKAQKLADAALESIVTELEANLELVKASREYHEGLVQMLQTKMGTAEAPSPNEFPRGFINPAWVTETAWEVAKETGVLADFEYQTVLTLSATYGRFQHYTKQADMAGELVYGKLFAEGTQGIAAKPMNLMTIIYTFIFRERQLEESLSATLTELNS
jgi:hypothetical protein